MSKRMSQKEKNVRNELNNYYVHGCKKVKACIRDNLAKKAANDMTYKEMCKLRDELNVIQNVEEIGEIDTELDEIAVQEQRLKERREELYQNRHEKFCKCNSDMSYEIYDEYENSGFQYRHYYKCRILLRVGNQHEIIFDESILTDEPYNYEVEKCPEEKRKDFLMLWRQAKQAIKEREQQDKEQQKREEEERRLERERQQKEYERQVKEEKERQRKEQDEREQEWRRIWSKINYGYSWNVGATTKHTDTMAQTLRKKIWSIIVTVTHPDNRGMTDDIFGKKIRNMIQDDADELMRHQGDLKAVLGI